MKNEKEDFLEPYYHPKEEYPWYWKVFLFIVWGGPIILLIIYVIQEIIKLL